jgi:hypothetical protein
VNQLIAASSVANTSTTDIYAMSASNNTTTTASLASDQLNEELKKSSLQKLTTSKSATRRLDRVYNLSSNMIEKATNKIKIGNLNEILLPLDKDFLDFIMEVFFNGNFKITKDFYKKLKRVERRNFKLIYYYGLINNENFQFLRYGSLKKYKPKPKLEI